LAHTGGVLLGGVVRGRPNPRYFRLPVRLKQALKRSGLTRRALSRKAGVSDPLIGYLESGERVPTVATIARVAFGLSVSAPWLAFGIGDSTAPVNLTASDTMAARLRATRMARALTKAALARMVGLSPSAFAKIENGGQSGIDVIEALAKALDVSPAWLAFGIGPQIVTSPRRGRPPAQSPATAH